MKNKTIILKKMIAIQRTVIKVTMKSSTEMKSENNNTKNKK